MLHFSLVLRIRFDDSTAVSVFGKKFGCDPHLEAENLLKLASDLDLNVIGTSFHVGSGCRNYKIYQDAIETCAHIFEVAKRFGFSFHLLDIGGGFPGNKNTFIDRVCIDGDHLVFFLRLYTFFTGCSLREPRYRDSLFKSINRNHSGTRTLFCGVCFYIGDQCALEETGQSGKERYLYDVLHQ
jgi:Pyridoxal-dependent decarboxylase, pyridoxal binding domain